MTSADQVSRLLALVPYLQRHPDADLDATAGDFGVSRKQLLADLDVLWYCGLPGGMPGDLIEIDMDAVHDSGRIRLSNAEYLARPMRFTPDEALSLIVALRAVRELSGALADDGVESALAKLERASGASLVPGVAVESGPALVRERLAAAIEAGTVVEFDYTDAGLEPSRPQVAPVRLIVSDGYGYLQAWSSARGGWRTYRLDRIDDVVVTSEVIGEVGEPPAFDPGWLESSGEARPVTLYLSSSVAWITEYIPVAEVRRAGEVVEVDLLVADPAWLRSVILRLGSGLLRVEPAQAAASARAAAAETLALYTAG